MKNLGHVSAYAYAKAQGYTGTEEEYSELMYNFAAAAESAAASASSAADSADDSEAYAIGKRGGSDVGSSDPAYHNNSKYYSGIASDGATTATNKAGEASNSASSASGSATSAGTNALKAEGYAVGKQNGSDVPSGDYYHNNAKYYASQASDSATSASGSASDASDSATAASGSATSAGTNALKSEGYAVGSQNGTAVEFGSPYYQNNAKYYSEQAASSLSSISEVIEDVSDLKDALSKLGSAYFVSSSGNDNNDGSSEHPLATFNKALTLGASVIIIAPGTYYQHIDLSLAKHGVVDLKKGDGGVVRFKPVAEQKLITSATLEDGYTKVYSATLNETIASGNNWLYQENVSDSTKIISEAERHPLQRGYIARTNATVIKKCSSATLSDALTEIETSSDYLWFADSGKLYFSCGSAVTSSNPISISRGEKLFENNSENITIKMTGIRCEFIAVNLDYTRDSELVDCSCGYVFGSGAITYDNAINTKLIRCETFCACNGSQGDGINAHYLTTVSATLAKRITGTLIDCWSHDNRDDGFSDHQACESTIIGGLFEYNGKAGITPSYGSHCTCYNVLSRNNYNGYYYTGASGDGGTGGQLLCVSCAAENNTRGSNQANAGFLVDSAGNKLILVNCHTSGNAIGYYVTTSAIAYLSNCTQADTQAVFGKARMTINNGTLIAPS